VLRLRACSTVRVSLYETRRVLSLDKGSNCDNKLETVDDTLRAASLRYVTREITC